MSAGACWLAILADMADGRWPWGKGVMVAAVGALYACGDESGIHEGARYCVVAGYLGDPDQWTGFDVAWRRALGLLEVFHAKDFFARPPSDAFACIDALTEAIHSHGVSHFGAIVDVNAFNALTYGERKFLTGGVWDGTRLKWLSTGAQTKPYFIVLQHCLREVATKTPHDKTAHFIFDRQRQFRARALETFYEAKEILAIREEAESRRLGDCAFKGKEGATPLQAADLLAHCWFSWATSGESMSPERRYALDRLATPVIPCYTKEKLEEIIGQLPDHVQESLRQERDPSLE